jgi:hypothetical protein
VAKVRRGKPLRLTVDGETVELAPNAVQVMATPRPGHAVAEEICYLAALETEITPELRDEGLARAFVHARADHAQERQRTGGESTWKAKWRPSSRRKR